ncbi:MAG: hypothetical protein LBU55_04105 [Elusimicrobiota bacterium]|jgi:hypothetical protein|nr:hypothetical protein [Elusimicrobiota bacterium]
MLYTLQIWVGVVLLILNVPVGWIGSVYFIGKARDSVKKKFFLFLGASTYIFSWFMLYVGIVLCGKKFASKLIKENKTLIILVTSIILIISIIFEIYRAKKANIKKQV